MTQQKSSPLFEVIIRCGSREEQGDIRPVAVLEKETSIEPAGWRLPDCGNHMVVTMGMLVSGHASISTHHILPSSIILFSITRKPVVSVFGFRVLILHTLAATCTKLFGNTSLTLCYGYY